MQAFALFGLQNLLLAVLVLRLGNRLLPEADVFRRLTGTLVLFPVIAVLSLQFLSLIGPITSVRATVLLFLLVCTEVGLSRGRVRPPAPPTRFFTREISWLEAIGFGVLVGVWFVWVRGSVWNAPQFFADDLTYHAALPASWLQSLSFAPPAFTYQSYYPLNVELLTFWFMLPTGSDAQANLVVLIWVSILGAAVVSIARNLQIPRATAYALGVAFIVAKPVMHQARSFTGQDVGVLACFLAALVFAFPESSGRRARRIDAALCGLAIGFALGSKIPMITMVFVLSIWWIFEGLRDRAPRGLESVTPFVIFIGCAFATGSYWYLQNIWLSGNPIFPAAVGPFAGPFTSLAQTETSMWGYFEHHDLGLDALLKVLRIRLRFPTPIGLLFVAGLLGSPLAVRRCSLAGDKIGARYLVLLISMAVIALIFYPSQPFSATANLPGGMMHHQLRYLFVPFAMGLLLFPKLWPSDERARIFGVVLLGAAVLHALYRFPLEVKALVAGCGCIASLATWAVSRRRMPIPSRYPFAFAAFVLASLSLVVILRGSTKQMQLDFNLYQYSGYGGNLRKGWQEIEKLPVGSHLAYLSNAPSSHANYYSQFGRRFQLVPVPIDRAGHIRQALHSHWREQPEDWWWEFGDLPPVDPDFVANLRSGGVDYILVNRRMLFFQTGEDSPWPEARALLNHSTTARAVYRDTYSEIYELGR